MSLIDLTFFIIFQLLIVYPLGKIVLTFIGVKLWWFPNLVFGINIGIVVLSSITLILGYTNNYNLLPLLIVFPSIYFMILAKKNLPLKFDIRKFINISDLAVILAILLCVLLQSIIVFPNGITPEGNLRIKNVFTEDGMWHIAIINNLKKSIPPENALFSGEKLTNYNYFSDIYITVIHKFTNIEILPLYFKLVGPFLSFLCAASLYFILKVLTKNKIISALGVLFITIGSTYYYIFAIFRPGLIPGNFFGNDYVSRMVNYQLSFSYLIISSFLFLLLISKRINSLKFLLISAALVSIGVGFKSYGTILVIVALYIIGFFKTLKGQFDYMKIAFLSTIFTGIITVLFLRNNNASDTIFSFNPFWMIENMFSDPLRLNSPAWEAKRDWFIEQGNYLGISYLYLKGLAIFLFTGLGIKLLGLLSVLKNREAREKEVVLLIAIVSLLGIIAPLTFTQGGVRWNTIQFIYYSGFGLGTLLILFVDSLKERIGLKLTLVTLSIVWASYLPGVYYYSKFYLSDTDNLTTYNFKGTQESYQAAKFLSTFPEGTLLLDSNYSQTPFVIAISGKNAYFADESILSNLLIDWHPRNNEVQGFFSESSTEDSQSSFLQKNNITYIFTSKDRLKSKGYLQNIYNNNAVSIYKTKYF